MRCHGSSTIKHDIIRVKAADPVRPESHVGAALEDPCDMPCVPRAASQETPVLQVPVHAGWWTDPTCVGSRQGEIRAEEAGTAPPETRIGASPPAVGVPRASSFVSNPSRRL